MKDQKKRIKALLFIVSISIVLLFLVNFTSMAQWYYQDYFTLFPGQNSTNYNWQQNYRLTHTPFYTHDRFSPYAIYQLGQPMFSYNFNYPNYQHFGNNTASNYIYTNFTNFGNFQLLTPSFADYYQNRNTFNTFNSFNMFNPAFTPLINGYNLYSQLVGGNPFSQNSESGFLPEIPSPEPDADDYIAVLPQVLHIAQQENVSIILLKEERPASGKVQIALSKEGEKILETQDYVHGKGTIELMVPDVEEGEYELSIKGEGFEDRARVNLVEDILVFLQTDKPIYQPEQTIHMRVIILDSELRPKSRPAVIEVQDAKGIKIFRKDVITDDYGMAALDLPIAREPNLGVWKITTLSNQASTQLDIRVEKYVLPKYEVKLELPREWFLVDEPITGKVKAEYSFGKPVKGDLEIQASRYVGEWKVYETLSKEIEDGECDFMLSPVGYVAGVPEAGGLGNITLDITVKEKNTGYEEKTNKLITISSSPINLQIIPEGAFFKPSLPFNILIITKTPDNKPQDTQVGMKITYINEKLDNLGILQKALETIGGKAVFTLTPPQGCVALLIEANAEGMNVSKALESSFSPSGNFIHLEQISQGTPNVGEEMWFKVHSTNEAVHFYYEVISRGSVIFSDFTGSSEISFVVTPQMSPQSKLLVYQILPNSEVAADYLPFEAEAVYPHSVTAEFEKEEVRPGEEISITIQTQGEAKVGLAVVDKSVFILAENRLNLQQVFEELERLYMKPQAELHAYSIYSQVNTKGAQETFKDAGVLVLSNKNIPKGMEYKNSGWGWGVWGGDVRDGMWFAAFPSDFKSDTVGIETPGSFPEPGTLAEVEKIRQFFPETWLWEELITDAQGYASLKTETPDTITTWMLQAVALSQEKGLGICEDELKAFQPFFIKVDLPYSAIRGEEFPMRVSIYNYLNEKQDVLIEIEQGDWFDLLDNPSKTVQVQANDLGGAQFKIRPTQLGVKEIQVSARSGNAADALIKRIIIIPEGVEKEYAENLVLSAGASRGLHTLMPQQMVEGSGRAYIAATSSYLTQTIEGLDGLLKMPCGCGEQNMIFLAPDIYITQYLKQTGQIKPEIMAKAEKLMITGYQRELTYRRSDGSFSAFGQSDQEGSLWLTAFVLKVFSQAKDLMYIDNDILMEAKNWIMAHQKSNGSFDPVGFLHHKEMIGGLGGKTALTAFVAIAIQEAAEVSSFAKTVSYLEATLDGIQDAYTMALVTYALELAQSTMKDKAYNKLMELSVEDEDGLHWPADQAQIEATAYATLALITHGDKLNAAQAAKWLVSQRNPSGGFSSTQDTIVALEALTKYAKQASADVDLTIEIEGKEIDKTLNITAENFDVLQVIELPINEEIQIRAKGKGEAVIQLVKRFNLPDPQKEGQIFRITVDYDSTEVEVNDLVSVLVELEFIPPMPIEAGMIVLDISVPTGFIAVSESLEDIIEKQEKIKRYEIAGRKVIFYIENMLPNESLAFSFKVKAQYPVKTKAATSQAYSYYNPKMRGETLSKEMIVLDH